MFVATVAAGLAMLGVSLAVLAATDTAAPQGTPQPVGGGPFEVPATADYALYVPDDSVRHDVPCCSTATDARRVAQLGKREWVARNDQTGVEFATLGGHADDGRCFDGWCHVGTVGVLQEGRYTVLVTPNIALAIARVEPAIPTGALLWMAAGMGVAGCALCFGVAAGIRVIVWVAWRTGPRHTA